MTEWQIDGTPLQDKRRGWRVDGESLIPYPPTRAVELVEVPFLDGATPVPGGMQPTVLTIRVFVESGKPGSFDLLLDRQADFYRLVQEGEWLTFVGDKRQKREARILRAIVSQPERAGWCGVFLTTEFTLAPYWRDPDLHTVTVPLSGGSGQRVQLEPFRDSTAPLVDAVITVSGPFTRLQLDAGDTGVTVEARTAAGETAVIDCRDHSVTVAGKRVAFDYPGGGFLKIPAATVGDPYPVVTATVAGVDRSYSKLTVEGHTWFL